MIEIADGLYIDREPYNWTVKEKVNVKDKKTDEIKEKLQVKGYYSKFTHALFGAAQRLQEREIEQAGDMPLAEAVKRVENADRRVIEAIKQIIENPKSIPHHLTDYWCLKPAVIDKDRRKNGDYYKKPTQYWFINCKPKNNLVFEALDYVPQVKSERVTKSDFGIDRTTARSMIHPQYANRFIRQYLIDKVHHVTK